MEFAVPCSRTNEVFMRTLKDLSLSTMCFPANINGVHEFRLMPQCKWNRHFSGMFKSIDWYLVTDVLGQPVSPIRLTLENGTDRLSQNFGN